MQFMLMYQIDAICLQETYTLQAEHYSIDGFKIILSGAEGVTRSWAGVGFIIAPHATRFVQSFMQYSDRMAYLKMRTDKGKVGIFSVYAPHNLRAQDERLQFYLDLTRLYTSCSANVAKVILGDYNARLGMRKVGEEDVIGPFSVGREAAHSVAIPNRDLLLEFCFEHDLVISNTFHEACPEQKFTFREIGCAPSAPVSSRTHAMVDLVLISRDNFGLVSDLLSIKEAALATDHFLVRCRLNCSLQSQRKLRQQLVDKSRLADEDTQAKFSHAFYTSLTDARAEYAEASSWDHVLNAFRAAELTLPKSQTKPNKPWISNRTFALISFRQQARAQSRVLDEKFYHKEIRRSVKRDRSEWIERTLADGTWKALNALRKPPKAQPGKLRNALGELVSSESRASTFADYLESVQWMERKNGAPEVRCDKPLLNVDVGQIYPSEVCRVLKRLKANRSAGPNGIPPEYWRALLCCSECVSELTLFLNRCWMHVEIPEDWHLAHVSLLYKKGPVDQCENYRPISLLDVGYKLFAAIIKDRLVRGGAEQRLGPTQFGFRSGHSTVDAIFILRRKIEVALAQRGGQLLVLALDWAKAFDAVNTEAMLLALARFGIPPHVCNIVSAIYSKRIFKVKDGEHLSSPRRQRSGISQGCPLSPFLFVILMSIIMEDAVSLLREGDAQHVDHLLYADDTVLIDGDAFRLQRFLAAVTTAGARYGLAMHWGKLQLLRVNTWQEVCRPDGSLIDPCAEIVHLGSSLSADGSNRSELTRRLGAAKMEFLLLSKVWRHSSLSRSEKLYYFNALVCSKLLYALATLCLRTAERRRLDGFYCRCLRVILGIPSAYVSRISNKCVLDTAGLQPLTHQLLLQQLVLYGKCARAGPITKIRNAVFFNRYLTSTCDRYVRRTGRPSLEWATFVGNHAVAAVGSFVEVLRLISCEVLWRQRMTHYCKSL